MHFVLKKKNSENGLKRGFIGIGFCLSEYLCLATAMRIVMRTLTVTAKLKSYHQQCCLSRISSFLGKQKGSKI